VFDEKALEVLSKGFFDSKLARWTADFRKRFADWVMLYEDVNDLAYWAVGNRLNTATSAQILAWTLFLRIVTSYQAALILAGRGLEAECKTILRSLAEATFALVAIEKNENFSARYLRHNQFEELRWMKKWNEVNEGKHKDLQKKIASLASSTQKDKISVREIAKCAGMEAVFNVHYSELCMFGHPTTHSLSFRMRKDQRTHMVATHLNPTSEDALDNLRVGIMFMMYSLKAIWNICKFPEPERFFAMKERFDKMVSKLPIFDLRTSRMLSETP
jgi:hypothetical protein